MAKYKTYYEGGFPFETGHWDEWHVCERFQWLRNLDASLRADDARPAANFGLSQDDLYELGADLEVLRQECLREIDMVESQILDNQVRILLFEEVMLRGLHEKTPIPAKGLPSQLFTRKAEHNEDTRPLLTAAVEKFAQMSQQELIDAAWAEVVHVRANIGKDQFATEEFATRLSSCTTTLEKAVRAAESKTPKKGN